MVEEGAENRMNWVSLIFLATLVFSYGGVRGNEVCLAPACPGSRFEV